MNTPSQNRHASRWPVYIVSGLFAAVVLLFIIALIDSGAVSTSSTGTLTASTYMDIVTPLLENANPADGETLISTLPCATCHRTGADRVAPSFVGIAQRAATRRPPLTAAAYIYESITNPTAYIVPGYQPAMPQNFREQLTDQQLGDIIAYLLTPDAH